MSLKEKKGECKPQPCSIPKNTSIQNSVNRGGFGIVGILFLIWIGLLIANDVTPIDLTNSMTVIFWIMIIFIFVYIGIFVIILIIGGILIFSS